MSAAQNCQQCGKSQARSYEQYSYAEFGVPVEPALIWLCAKCARTQRRELVINSTAEIASGKITREELIAALDKFWQESGALEICRRCHEQGTGCCPPMCRYLSAEGCQKKNVFCTGFLCSALLNAIAECDSELGRAIKWIKQNVAPAEFRLYEMITRVPAIDREQTRPLNLPISYPSFGNINGASIRPQLMALMDEILLIRRQWRKAESESIIS